MLLKSNSLLTSVPTNRTETKPSLLMHSDSDESNDTKSHTERRSCFDIQVVLPHSYPEAGTREGWFCVRITDKEVIVHCPCVKPL